MKTYLYLSAVAIGFGIANAAFAHFFYIPILSVLSLFALSYFFGRYLRKGLLFWAILCPVVVAFSHGLIVSLTDDYGRFYGSIPGSFLYSFLICCTAFLLGRDHEFLSWKWTPLAVLTCCFVFLATVYPKRILDNRHIDFTIPVSFNLGESLSSDKLHPHCGTCRNATKQDYYTMQIADLDIRDSLLLCVHFDRAIDNRIVDYEFQVSDSTDRLIRDHFGLEIDSAFSIGDLKYTRSLSESGIWYRVKLSMGESDKYALFHKIVAIPHILTCGSL